MKKPAALLIGVILIGLAFTVVAQSDYDISWWTIGGGGGSSAMGDYVVGGTIGQAEAGPSMSGGDYSLSGGYGAEEPPPVTAGELVYLPIIVK